MSQQNPLDKFEGGEYFNRPDKVASIVKDYLKPDSNVKMEDIMKKLLATGDEEIIEVIRKKVHKVLEIEKKKI